MNPANQALEPTSLVSKGNFNKLALRHLLRLSIALFNAWNLGVRNLPLIRLNTLITASEFVILYLQFPSFSV